MSSANQQIDFFIKISLLLQIYWSGNFVVLFTLIHIFQNIQNIAHVFRKMSNWILKVTVNVQNFLQLLSLLVLQGFIR